MADVLDAGDDPSSERIVAAASLSRVANAIATASYRDGLETGETAAVQTGFDLGFERAAKAAFLLGQLLGGLRSAALFRQGAAPPEEATGSAAHIGRVTAAVEALLRAVATHPAPADASGVSGGLHELLLPLPSLCAEVAAILRAVGLGSEDALRLCEPPSPASL